MREIKYIVIHCSATKEGQEFHVSDIDRWHKAQGWASVGYHWIITLDGKVEKGRDESMVGAHVSGYNSNSIGICYIGGLDKDGKSKDTRTDKQKAALWTLLVELIKKYPKAVIKGHRDFPNVKKSCPCFDAMIEYGNINLNEKFPIK